jgi:hypothetical protein
MSKQDELQAAYEDALGRGDREAAVEALNALQALRKPEKAVQAKRTETRKKKG